VEYSCNASFRAERGNREHGLPRDPAHPHALKAVVVDDHVDGGTAFAMVLSYLGCSTRLLTTAYRLPDALRSFMPDVVFLDIALPGISGDEAARALRKDPSYSKLFLVAHTATDSSLLDWQDAGFDLHLLKPADVEMVKAVLLEAARRAGRLKETLYAPALNAPASGRRDSMRRPG